MKSKLWQVIGTQDKGTKVYDYVYAPNKMFARTNFVERNGYGFVKITASAMRGQ